MTGMPRVQFQVEFFCRIYYCKNSTMFFVGVFDKASSQPAAIEVNLPKAGNSIVAELTN